jgi:hypothetical protein
MTHGGFAERLRELHTRIRAEHRRVVAAIAAHDLAELAEAHQCEAMLFGEQSALIEDYLAGRRPEVDHHSPGTDTRREQRKQKAE